MHEPIVGACYLIIGVAMFLHYVGYF